MLVYEKEWICKVKAAIELRYFIESRRNANGKWVSEKTVAATGSAHDASAAVPPADARSSSTVARP